MIFVPPVAKVWIGDGSVLESDFVFPKRDQLISFRKRQRVEQYSVDNTENRRVGSDPKCQRSYCHDRETPRLHQNPESIPNVLNKRFHKAYSYLRATMGSTFAARCAGSAAEARATAAIIKHTTATVGRS